MKLCTWKVIEMQGVYVIVVLLHPFSDVVTALACRCFAKCACFTVTGVILCTGLMYVHVLNMFLFANIKD
jgi:hypothetical protein